MTGLILCVLALFVILFAVMLLKQALVKSENGKKKSLNFKGTGAATIISKLLWAAVGTAIVIYCLTLFVPLIWMLYNSVKDPLVWDMPGVSKFSLPAINDLHFEHYAQVIANFEVSQGSTTYGITDMFINSIYYSAVAPIVSVGWMTLVAYVLARFKFFGGKFLYNFGILIMMIPIAGSNASQMMVLQKMNLYDRMYIKVLIPPATAFSGLYFMIIYVALKAIPQTYTEAAQIDGANPYTIMFRIILPMALPTVATVYILSFIADWNNYENFLIWYPSTPNISYGMYRMGRELTSKDLSQVHVFAGYTIIIIPSMILYLSGQKLMRSNFMVGGLKG